MQYDTSWLPTRQASYYSEQVYSCPSIISKLVASQFFRLRLEKYFQILFKNHFSTGSAFNFGSGSRRRIEYGSNLDPDPHLRLKFDVAHSFAFIHHCPISSLNTLNRPKRPQTNRPIAVMYKGSQGGNIILNIFFIDCLLIYQVHTKHKDATNNFKSIPTVHPDSEVKKQ